MALSTPPPPPDANPSTTSSTTTTTHPTRLPFPPNPGHPPPQPHPHPRHHYPAAHFYPPHPHHPNLVNPRLPSNPNPNYSHISPSPHPLDLTTATSTSTATATATLYPVASSGRGFLPKQPSSVAVNNLHPNSHLYQARPGCVSYPRPVFGYSQSDPGQVPGMGYGYGRATTHLQHPGTVAAAAGGGGATAMPGVIKGVPVSGASSQSQHKIAPSSTSISDCNGHKEIRERSRDDSVVTIRDRKVRVSDNASLYALCRSWLRNGFPDESQPVHMDAARSLPRPLPLPAQDSILPLKKEDAKEEEEEKGSVENLTPEELLQTHIKRAKKVRSRLREERLQRIARYKTRLALLLPPMVEQQLRNDSASGI